MNVFYVLFPIAEVTRDHCRKSTSTQEEKKTDLEFINADLTLHKNGLILYCFDYNTFPGY